MHTAPKAILIALTLGTLQALDATPARALQLLTNFGFDSGLTSWDGCCGGTGTVSFDGTLDAHGSALSGSAKLLHTQPGAGTSALFLTRCLSGPDVAPGKQLVFGMKARFAAGETTDGQVTMSLDFRADVGCSGGLLAGTGQGVNTMTSPRGSWLTIKRNVGGAITVPAGTKSVKVFLTSAKFAPGTVTINVDDVYVAPVGTPMCDELPATQVGTGDNDFINGTSDSDVIVGKGGIDWIDGHEGNDHLCGGPGDDVLYGGLGDDRLFGEGGKDTLLGAKNDDLLDGGSNNDTLEGGDGTDKLRGGSGFDTCNDGLGTSFKTCEAVPAAS